MTLKSVKESGIWLASDVRTKCQPRPPAWSLFSQAAFLERLHLPKV